jgi:hypothetical protein
VKPHAPGMDFRREARCDAHPAVRPARGVVAAILVAGAALLAGCASDSAAGGAPEHPGGERPDGITPEGVTDVRESLADRRAASRDLMDETLLRPTSASASSSSSSSDGSSSGVFGFLGTMLTDVANFVGFHAFGIW